MVRPVARCAAAALLVVALASPLHAAESSGPIASPLSAWDHVVSWFGELWSAIEAVSPAEPPPSESDRGWGVDPNG